jgi:hypothetical protein
VRFGSALMVLFYALLPQQIETRLVLAAACWTSSGQEWRWLEHLTNAFYALVLVVWEPIYVCVRFQPVPEPAYIAGSVGYRASVPPFAPAGDGQRTRFDDRQVIAFSGAAKCETIGCCKGRRIHLQLPSWIHRWPTRRSLHLPLAC